MVELRLGDEMGRIGLGFGLMNVGYDSWPQRGVDLGRLYVNLRGVFG